MNKIVLLIICIIPITLLGQRKLQIISETPKEIDGCSCYFSFSKKEFDRNEHFYYNNFANLSYIKINGELKELNLSNEPETTNFNYFEYKKEGILMKIWIEKKQNSGDEVAYNIGRYRIYEKNKLIFKGTFFGECGC